MDRCTLGRKERGRSYQTLEVKEAINNDRKGKAFHLGRYKVLGCRAQWQSTGTKEVEKYTWGLVFHACLDLAVRTHEKY